MIITWKPSVQFPVSHCPTGPAAWELSSLPSSVLQQTCLLPPSVLLKVKKYPRTTEAALAKK